MPRGVDRLAGHVDRDVRRDGEVHAGTPHRHAARRQVDVRVLPPRPAERPALRRGHDVRAGVGVRVRAAPEAHVAHLVRLHEAVAVDVAVEPPPVDGVGVGVGGGRFRRAERLLDLVHRERAVPHRQLVHPSAEVLIRVAGVLRKGRAVVRPPRMPRHAREARRRLRRPARVVARNRDRLLVQSLVAGDDERHVVRPVLTQPQAVGHVVPLPHRHRHLLVAAAGIGPGQKRIRVEERGRPACAGALDETERLADGFGPVVAVVEKDAVGRRHGVPVVHDAGDDRDVLAVHLDVAELQTRLETLVRGRVARLARRVERGAVDGLALGGEAHVHPRPEWTALRAVHGRRHGGVHVAYVVNLALLHDRAVRAAVVELPPQPRVVEHRRPERRARRDRRDAHCSKMCKLSHFFASFHRRVPPARRGGPFWLQLCLVR